MVDTGAFVPVYQRIEEYLVNKSYIHRKGPYRVSKGMSFFRWQYMYLFWAQVGYFQVY